MGSGILTDREFDLIRGYIEKNCGILLGDEKAYLVENRLIGLLAECGCTTFMELYNKTTSDRTLALRDKIVDAMTTNETLWFRDGAPFRILDEVILPRLAEEIRQGKRERLRIWSAGCSTGQEPYSLAIQVQEFARRKSALPLGCVEIMATDISASMIFLAMAGRYNQLALSRGLPDEIRGRYFTREGSVWSLDDRIKRMVTFKRLNLQERFAVQGGFDLILCRYVAIYFSDLFKRDLFARMAHQLRPDGYLFVGATESVSNYSAEFSALTHEGHYYYQVNGGSGK